MAVLCKLADPAGYVPFDWDMSDPESLGYWLDLFGDFAGKIERWLREDQLTGADFESRWLDFSREYSEGIRRRRENPSHFGVNTITLGVFLRQSLLKKYGWPDPYMGVKRRENALASALYPDVIAQVDAMPAKARWESLFRGVFAGNMFDLGSTRTIEMYDRGHIDYQTILQQIPERPWYIDHLDAMRERLEPAPRYRQALFFVDNAGTDIVLGVIPLVRELARAGIRVVMAANSEPALNDITIDELNPLLDRLSAADPVLGWLRSNDRIATVGSGSGSPLIDLSQISDACNAVANESDLVVLEGMGRGVESNWRQTFTCDAWRIALVKDEMVAKWLGCRMFDPVCRFDVGVGSDHSRQRPDGLSR